LHVVVSIVVVEIHFEVVGMVDVDIHFAVVVRNLFVNLVDIHLEAADLDYNKLQHSSWDIQR